MSDFSYSKINTKKIMPVLFPDKKHIIANVDILQERIKDDKVTITIVAEGPQAKILGDFVAANEIVALSFDGLPIEPVIKKEK